ncbi:MAG TPA: WXG100 family type VII secretion target [Jatrophihabitans sp.]|nr:WXG100 family type VII secretion target [Jatrophihabitans sp.]
MSPLPDPDELEAIAARIRAHATAARDRAVRLDRLVAAARWRGVAAAAFDGLAAEVVAGLRRSAGRLDDAADALLRHAANVRHMLATLAQLQGDGLRIGADLGTGLVDELLHPGSLPGDAAGVLTDAAHAIGHLGALIGIG